MKYIIYWRISCAAFRLVWGVLREGESKYPNTQYNRIVYRAADHHQHLIDHVGAIGTKRETSEDMPHALTRCILLYLAREYKWRQGY